MVLMSLPCLRVTRSMSENSNTQTWREGERREERKRERDGEGERGGGRITISYRYNHFSLTNMTRKWGIEISFVSLQGKMYLRHNRLRV